jgi:hypothetical protein
MNGGEGEVNVGYAGGVSIEIHNGILILKLQWFPILIFMLK